MERTPQHADFLRDIVATCEKHGLWLGHEDDNGAFVVQQESTAEWILAAITAAEYAAIRERLSWATSRYED